MARDVDGEHEDSPLLSNTVGRDVSVKDCVLEFCIEDGKEGGKSGFCPLV
jgi:hypothetical protein